MNANATRRGATRDDSGDNSDGHAAWMKLAERCKSAQDCACLFCVCVWVRASAAQGVDGEEEGAQRRAKVKYTRIYCTACLLCVAFISVRANTHCLSLSLSPLFPPLSFCVTFSLQLQQATHTHTHAHTNCVQRTFDFVRRKVNCKLRCSNAEAQLFVSCSAVLSAARVFREKRNETKRTKRRRQSTREGEC